MHGVTLLELIVVLALLGLVFGFSGVAVASLRTPPAALLLQELERARVEAIRSGNNVTVRQDSVTVLFLPDGRVIRAPR